MARSPIKHLIEKEGIATILFLAFCTALALMFPAGVGTSNQAPTVIHAVAPWIFGPFQILLLYLPPWLGALLIPMVIVVGLTSLPWLVEHIGERWGQRIFAFLFSSIIFMLLWFMGQELWWA